MKINTLTQYLSKEQESKYYLPPGALKNRRRDICVCLVETRLGVQMYLVAPVYRNRDTSSFSFINLSRFRVFQRATPTSKNRDEPCRLSLRSTSPYLPRFVSTRIVLIFNATDLDLDLDGAAIFCITHVPRECERDEAQSLSHLCGYIGHIEIPTLQRRKFNVRLFAFQMRQLPTT